jgi:hypothetical protein
MAVANTGTNNRETRVLGYRLKKFALKSFYSTTLNIFLLSELSYCYQGPLLPSPGICLNSILNNYHLCFVREVSVHISGLLQTCSQNTSASSPHLQLSWCSSSMLKYIHRLYLSYRKWVRWKIMLKGWQSFFLKFCGLLWE